eukprot:scaffold6860_cov297-Chaetoceros_neogracile.AAC.13
MVHKTDMRAWASRRFQELGNTGKFWILCGSSRRQSDINTNTSTMKTCGSCTQSLPPSFYSKNQYKIRTYRRRCKKCVELGKECSATMGFKEEPCCDHGESPSTSDNPFYKDSKGPLHEFFMYDDEDEDTSQSRNHMRRHKLLRVCVEWYTACRHHSPHFQVEMMILQLTNLNSLRSSIDP